MTKKSPIAPMTEEQKKVFFEIVQYAAEMALSQVQIDYDQFMRVVENLGELRDAIALRVIELATSDLYSKNDGSTNPIYLYTYPKNFKTKPIKEQIDALHQFFPGVGSAEEDWAVWEIYLQHALADYHLNSIPYGAEGWRATLRWERIAPTYGQAVEKVLEKIASLRQFKNSRQDGRPGLSQLCRREDAAKMAQRLGDEQKEHSILVFPAQFGLAHSRHSVRRTRGLLPGRVLEFELGAFEVGIMLLTHPERLQSADDLGIICSGDEFAPGAYGSLSLAPSFSINAEGVMEFDARWCDYFLPGYGAATGFLPPPR